MCRALTCSRMFGPDAAPPRSGAGPRPRPAPGPPPLAAVLGSKLLLMLKGPNTAARSGSRLAQFNKPELVVKRILGRDCGW